MDNQVAMACAILELLEEGHVPRIGRKVVSKDHMYAGYLIELRENGDGVIKSIGDNQMYLVIQPLEFESLVTRSLKIRNEHQQSDAGARHDTSGRDERL
tara:strand:- start:7491 stop:7787 length:297 start_codon:yes stop_codon:yes gene_type:complete